MTSSTTTEPTTFYVVRVNEDRYDCYYAGSTLKEALELAMPDVGDRIEYSTVQATDAGAARLMRPETWSRYHKARPTFYVTTRCNFAHRLSDGKPIAHECDVIPPAALAAEMEGDYDRAIDLIQAAKPLRHMLRGVKAAILLFCLSLPAFAAPPCKVNVNTATPEQLQLFARTGPVLALRLASARPYRRLEAVDAVKGVGPAWLAVNGPHVAFAGPTTCTAKVAAPKAPRVAAQAPKL